MDASRRQHAQGLGLLIMNKREYWKRTVNYRLATKNDVPCGRCQNRNYSFSRDRKTGKEFARSSLYCYLVPHGPETHVTVVDTFTCDNAI